MSEKKDKPFHILILDALLILCLLLVAGFGLGLGISYGLTHRGMSIKMQTTVTEVKQI